MTSSQSPSSSCDGVTDVAGEVGGVLGGVVMDGSADDTDCGDDTDL